MITYFIPIFNEYKKNKGSFKLFLEKLKKEIKKNNKNRFIILDDGSTDQSSILIKNLIKNIKNKNKNKILYLKNSENKGIGYSFKKSLKYCKTKFICPIPSDNDLPFVDPKTIIKKNVDHVIFFPINIEKYSLGRFFLSIMFRLIYNIIFNLRVHYIQGSFITTVKNAKRLNIRSNRFTFWAEVNLKALRMGLNYKDYPLYFNNESKLDRTVSFKNFFEIIISLFILVYEIYFTNKKKFNKKPTKIY